MPLRNKNGRQLLPWPRLDLEVIAVSRRRVHVDGGHGAKCLARVGCGVAEAIYWNGSHIFDTSSMLYRGRNRGVFG